MKYTAIVRKAPDGVYVANYPLILEAHAQGETYEKCLANIQEVLELCLEYRKERSEEIPDEIDTSWLEYRALVHIYSRIFLSNLRLAKMSFCKLLDEDSPFSLFTGRQNKLDRLDVAQSIFEFFEV